jgi:hypothetical protein
MLLDGASICTRGDLFRSLPMTDGHLARARDSLEKFAGRYKPLIERALAG